MSVANGRQTFFGRTVNVSSADKPFFPDAGLTKGDLVGFYVDVAELAEPYLHRRPAALRRYPDGIDADGFFQKDAADHFPAWLHRAAIQKEDGGVLDHPVIDEPAALVYLADQGTIEFHPWLSTVDALDCPDQAIFDFDPPEDEPAAARAGARRLGELLGELDLPGLVKTSGSKGFHVHIPLDGEDDYDTVRDFAGGLAALLARRHPDQLTVEHRKQHRGGRVFVDYLRNAYGQTAVGAYTVRASPGAPVATPITWEELADGIHPRQYTITNLRARLAQKPDPWQGHQSRASIAALDEAVADTLQGR